MQIISVANRKGGAGKTTTALNLAYGLAAHGKNVLAIDMDGQCNLSLLLGLEYDRLQTEEQQIYAVLTGKQPLRGRLVHFSDIKGVDLIPASPALYGADMTISRVMIPVQAELLSLYHTIRGFFCKSEKRSAFDAVSLPDFIKCKQIHTFCCVTIL